MVSIEAAGVEKDGLICRRIDLDIGIIEISVAESRLDVPPASLQRPEQPGDDLLNEVLSYITQLRVSTVGYLAILQCGPKLPCVILFPAVGPAVIHRWRAPESCDREAKFASGRDGRLMQVLDY